MKGRGTGPLHCPTCGTQLDEGYEATSLEQYVFPEQVPSAPTFSIQEACA